MVMEQGNCTGNGSYDDPYIYTSPVDPNTGVQFIIKRGQTIESDEFELQGTLIKESRQAQVDERQDKSTHPTLGLLTVRHQGSSLDLEGTSASQMHFGSWKRIFDTVKETQGSIVEFQDPVNPPAIVGVVKVSTIESTMHQDATGDSGDLEVACKITKPNPNPNNDPLAEDLKFNFPFDFNGDRWNASVDRKVNGTSDINDSASGSWSPYGAGTMVNLQSPTQPLSGAQTDWYIDGQYADDAWTLANNVHYHPGPLSFGFNALPEWYMEESCP